MIDFYFSPCAPVPTMHEFSCVPLETWCYINKGFAIDTSEDSNKRNWYQIAPNLCTEHLTLFSNSAANVQSQTGALHDCKSLRHSNNPFNVLRVMPVSILLHLIIIKPLKGGIERNERTEKMISQDDGSRLK